MPLFNFHRDYCGKSHIKQNAVGCGFIMKQPLPALIWKQISRLCCFTSSFLDVYTFQNKATMLKFKKKYKWYMPLPVVYFPISIAV